MKVVSEKISIEELKQMSQKMFGDFVKSVVDIERGIMVVDAEMHADEEMLLLEDGSKQEHLWGINIYPARTEDEKWIVFDSMINLRPSWGNRSRGVDDSKVQKIIIGVVNQLVTK